MQSVVISDNSSGLLLDDSSDSTACFMGAVVIFLCKMVLLLSLSILVLYHGLQQWRQHRSFKSASHSDIFTYHAAAFQIILLLAMFFRALNELVPIPYSNTVLKYFLHLPGYGESFLHALTCVERYLAVVHPIVYMRLRNERGVRIRNISIACVWILSVILSGIIGLYLNSMAHLSTLIPIALCLVAVSFCSLSVLFVLIRPGPGDGAQDRDRVDPAKKRAFCTVTAIAVVLWLWFGGLLFVYLLKITLLSNAAIKCAADFGSNVFSLASTSVLPLLYLHRAGKLSTCLLKNG